MRTAIYPGSFDPVTFGHLDIIQRASHVMDHLIVGVLNNNSKSPLFSVEERVKMLKEVTAHLPNVEVQSFGGLLVDFAVQSKASVIIRGLRAITDFEYELQMSQTNRKIAPNVDTIFFTTNLKYAYLCSSIVKEVAMFGGNIDEFVYKNDIVQCIIADKDFDRIKNLIPKIEKVKDVEIKNRHKSLIDSSYPRDNTIYCDVANIESSKGNAIEKLCQYLNIDLKDVISIGDDFNDLSMFEKVGLSVAMKNANEIVREKADEITLSNEDNGVAVFLEEIILK